MRIVHEIDESASVSCGGALYGRAADEEVAGGFKASALLLVEERGLVSGEELHVEGNARHVLAALKELIVQIELIGDAYVRDGKLRADWRGPERERFLASDASGLVDLRAQIRATDPGELAEAFFQNRGIVVADPDACDLACGIRLERDRVLALLDGQG